MGDVYYVNYKVEKRSCHFSVREWHSRLGHCGKVKLQRTLQDIVPKKEVEEFYQQTCRSCAMEKGQEVPIPRKTKETTIRRPLEILVADTIGPYPLSINRKRGALVVGDVGSQFLWFLPVLRKSEIPEKFIILLDQLERSFPGQVTRIRTDNGTEFINSKLKKYCKGSGIFHEKSVPYIHQMNGRVEKQQQNSSAPYSSTSSRKWITCLLLDLRRCLWCL